MKIAILISHPIQYLVPFFKTLSKENNLDLSVFFTWKFGVEPTYDREFKKKIIWDIPVLEGYKYEFLKNYSPKPYSDFLGQINPSIIKKLIFGRFDAIIIFGWNSFTNWIAFLFAFLTGTKVFLRGENPLNQEMLKSKWKILFKKIVFKILFCKISAFLYIGEENKKFYEYYGVPEKKLFFVPYAVDNDRFIEAALKLKNKKEELRKELLNIEDNRQIILFTGKLIEKKRPFDLLKAYQLLVANYKLPKVPALVFIGDGFLRNNLEEYVKEHNLKSVYFVGFKNQTELPEYYAIADLFVLPSGVGETWGLVVNEAMCFGLPVIVSDMVGCAPDLIKENQNGFKFKLGGIEELSSFLYKTLINKNLMGKKSFEIIKDYSFKKGAKTISLLLETINKK